MYDLTLVPIHIQRGQPIQKPSGFCAASPPRRTARSRSDDMLIMSLITQGGASISTDDQAAWLDHLSQVFFKTSGSVTSALRSLIETLNLTLMEKNLKLSKEGGWMTGAINLVAVHRRSLYIAQSGLTHAFTLTHEGLQQFKDPMGSDRGLGVSRTPTIRYFQADLGTSGYLFMTDSPPETWREDLLLADGFPTLESLRRRLLNQAPVDFRLDLVQLRPGEGQIKTITPVVRPEKQPPETALEPVTEQAEIESPAPPPLEVTTPEVSQQDTQKIQALQQEDVEADSVPASGMEESQKPQPPDVSKTTGASLPPEPQPAETKDVQTPRPDLETPAGSSEPASTQEVSETAPQKKNTVTQLRKEAVRGLASFFDWWHAAWNKIGIFFQDLFSRFRPEGNGQSVQLSRSTLLWVSILVPILVVALAVGVYLSRGRRLQYDYYLRQAQAAVQTAHAAEDPAVERSAWYEVLNSLDQADDIRNTNEVAALRQEVQDALDILDGALRLAYQPALRDTLSTEINITEMVSYGRDLYLFDDASGWVIHAIRDNDLYEVNTDFLCAPGNYSGGALSAIVDMVALPINNPYQAQILAIDEIGNVAYCSPGQDPIVQLLPEMEGSASEALKIAYENSTLYVLNPSSGSVMVYSATNGQFLEPPGNYFSGAAAPEVPDFTKVVDMDVNGPELYLLRGDGSLVNCVYSGRPDNPVTCQKPVDYLDGRPGLEDQTLTLPEGNFTSLFYTPPPTPLVNILDATNAEIYRFSLRFRLYQRLRPELGDHEVDGSTATAFTMGEIEPLAFIAFGNQVFFAYVE